MSLGRAVVIMQRATLEILEELGDGTGNVERFPGRDHFPERRPTLLAEAILFGKLLENDHRQHRFLDLII